MDVLALAARAARIRPGGDDHFYKLVAAALAPVRNYLCHEGVWAVSCGGSIAEAARLFVFELPQHQRHAPAELRHGDLGRPDDRLDLFERAELPLAEGVESLMFRRLHGAERSADGLLKLYRSGTAGVSILSVPTTRSLSRLVQARRGRQNSVDTAAGPPALEAYIRKFFRYVVYGFAALGVLFVVLMIVAPRQHEQASADVAKDHQKRAQECAARLENASEDGKEEARTWCKDAGVVVKQVQAPDEPHVYAATLPNEHERQRLKYLAEYQRLKSFCAETGSEGTEAFTYCIARNASDGMMRFLGFPR